MLGITGRNIPNNLLNNNNTYSKNADSSSKISGMIQ